MHNVSADESREVALGRLLVADAVEAHLSVIDLSTDAVDSGVFEIAAPGATVYPSPSHRYGIILASGPEDGDDRIHVFDGGVYLAEHDDHYDLITQPVSRHALEIAEEQPIHYVNNHGWTAIFADINGHVLLINEAELIASSGDYEPLVIEAGPHHGAALAISEEHIAVTVPHPDFPESPDPLTRLPIGVEVRTFNNEVVYDASREVCPGGHGEAHNAHGAVFGCWVGGVLFLHEQEGEYEHAIIPYPMEMAETLKLGLFYGHPHSDHFFSPATLFVDGQFSLGGVWLVDVVNGALREVFPEPSVSAVFSSDGNTFYILDYSGALNALDAHNGELIESIQLLKPTEPAFGVPTAAVIVVGEMLYVADPNSGRVLGVHLTHMEIQEEWEVGGAPSSLAFVGITVCCINRLGVVAQQQE